MLKKQQKRHLTDEQRQRIRNSPGVVVQKRESELGTSFYVPKVQPKRKLDITADELINAEEDEERFW
jgi:hypothetical protein